MSKNRRKFTKEFKAKVVLESLKERETLESLARKYELLPGQITTWKSQVLENFSNVFIKETSKNDDNSVNNQVLYAQIGQLKVENDFLKKKLQ